MVTAILKQNQLTPDEFLNKRLQPNNAHMSYEQFLMTFQTSFYLPQENVMELFNALLIDKA